MLQTRIKEMTVELGTPLHYCEVLEGIIIIRSCSSLVYIYIIDNYVHGRVLLNLSESKLLEMIPPIGLVKNILALTERLMLPEQRSCSRYTCMFVQSCNNSYVKG